MLQIHWLKFPDQKGNFPFEWCPSQRHHSCCRRSSWTITVTGSPGMHENLVWVLQKCWWHCHSHGVVVGINIIAPCCNDHDKHFCSNVPATLSTKCLWEIAYFFQKLPSLHSPTVPWFHHVPPKNSLWGWWDPSHEWLAVCCSADLDIFLQNMTGSLHKRKQKRDKRQTLKADNSCQYWKMNEDMIRHFVFFWTSFGNFNLYMRNHAD